MIKRREFLKITFLTFLSSVAFASTNRKIEYDEEVIRPPGAVKDFSSRCIRCISCLSACTRVKRYAISLAGISKGLKNLGTPVVENMREYPCDLCMECTKVCPTGALQEIPKEEVKMGIAVIDIDLCLGWNSDICLSCSKVCPFANDVFEFKNSMWGNQPYIKPDKCVGCGLCVKACITKEPAVIVYPIKEYKKIEKEYLTYLEYVENLPYINRYKLVYEINLPRIMKIGVERGREEMVLKQYKIR